MLPSAAPGTERTPHCPTGRECCISTDRQAPQNTFRTVFQRKLTDHTPAACTGESRILSPHRRKVKEDPGFGAGFRTCNTPLKQATVNHPLPDTHIQQLNKSAYMSTADFEKLGTLFLGYELPDPAHNTTDTTSPHTQQTPLLYDSRDLTTHAVIAGMTGSGKTGLGIALLEEAAIDGIPAICIDPKGDLGNLLLTFPNLEPADFEPWVDPQEASRLGLQPAEYARQTAGTWLQGLADWQQTPARIRRLRDAADALIYTPAGSAGLPLTVLKSFAPPAHTELNDPEILRQHIQAAAAGLLALLQIDADPVSSREFILLSSIFESAWNSGQTLTLETLIRSIQQPPFDRIGFLELEACYPQADRFKLAMRLNNLVASPGFAAWLHGEPLNIDRLLFSPGGKPRLAVISIAHLSDEERMFFVTMLLNELLAWMRRQSGTTSLRALLYMDEVFGYFPPVGNPPSKQPMLTLLKQARAFGLGIVLATQNPVDLDYKGLANCGTWFLGRLQTERDKARVLDGLEGAAGASGAAFSRSQMDQLLSSLGKRMFVVNNVHDSGPVLLQTRWTLSWLRGPLSRTQIERLMQPIITHHTETTAPDCRQRLTTAAAAAQQPGQSATSDTGRPLLPPEIPELFLPAAPAHDTAEFRPALLGQASLHFVDRKLGLDVWDQITLIHPAAETLPANPWEQAEEWDEAGFSPDTTAPADTHTPFRQPPAELARKRAFSAWTTALKNHLYSTRRLTVLSCPAADLSSEPGESESRFRIRLRQKVRETRDLAAEKLRRKYAARLQTLEGRLARAADRIEKQQAQQSGKRLSAAVSFGSTVLSALLGRRALTAASVSRAGSTIRSASAAAEKANDVRNAEEQHQLLQQQYDELQHELEAELQQVTAAHDADLLPLEQHQIPPRKADIVINGVSLLWLPFDSSGNPAF